MGPDSKEDYRICLRCEEPIFASEEFQKTMYFSGENATIAFLHKECALREVFGSVGHQKKTCSCYGGTEEDPPGMTKREAAKAAVELYLSTNSI